MYVSVSDQELKLRTANLKEKGFKLRPECILYRDLQLWPHVSDSVLNHVQGCERCQVMVTPSSQAKLGLVEKLFQWLGFRRHP